MKKRRSFYLVIITLFGMLAAGCTGGTESTGSQDYVSDVSMVPDFLGEPYIELNGNEPLFTQEDYVTEPFELYSDLDGLGRCGVAYANICRELMPTEKREAISSVKPSGWRSAKYDFVDGKYLYNRCHLIGFQLAGENANKRNLITGTRYMNVQGMLPFENMVADFVKETDYHVLYRVTPVFKDDNLVASGVVMEASSVEDEGEGVSFHVYVYNNQPGVAIDYATGESALSSDKELDDGNNNQDADDNGTYVLNENTRKFHLPDCEGAKSMIESNKREYTGSRESLADEGYEPCKTCKP